VPRRVSTRALSHALINYTAASTLYAASRRLIPFNRRMMARCFHPLFLDFHPTASHRQGFAARMSRRGPRARRCIAAVLASVVGKRPAHRLRIIIPTSAGGRVRRCTPPPVLRLFTTGTGGRVHRCTPPLVLRLLTTSTGGRVRRCTQAVARHWLQTAIRAVRLTTVSRCPEAVVVQGHGQTTCLCPCEQPRLVIHRAKYVEVDQRAHASSRSASGHLGKQWQV
jgi:hypothetical protein